MTRVRMDLFVSLDGCTPADPSPENPMGEEWGRLTAAYSATRTFRERVFGDTSGAGTTGVDDRFAAAHFVGIGAEIMGAAMFGLHTAAIDCGTDCPASTSPTRSAPRWPRAAPLT